jgi:serine/threonine protein kinase
LNLSLASYLYRHLFFQAPEIYLEHHRHGTAADWFAVGVTLHEFVTGRRPFQASTLQAFRRGETKPSLTLEFLESLDYLSDDCKDFIASLLVVKV